MEEVVGADIGRSAELRCVAEGNPPPHIIWTRKDRGSSFAQTLSTSSLYRIDVINRGSFGVYVCTASSSSFPDASREVLLLQNGKQRGGGKGETLRHVSGAWKIARWRKFSCRFVLSIVTFLALATDRKWRWWHFGFLQWNVKSFIRRGFFFVALLMSVGLLRS